MICRAAAVALGVLVLSSCSAGAAERSDVVVNPPPAEAQVRAEAAHVPAHAQTWLYYGFWNVNANINEHIPPEIMARYADFVEGGGGGEYQARFKAAGGRYAVAYTDAAYVPYCEPPFTPPAGGCKWGYYKYLGDESAWFHGRDGARIHHKVPGDQPPYQEAINPASPAARRAWREYTRDIKQRAPSVDFLLADDAGQPLHAGDMSPTSSHFYDFNEAGVEIQSDAVFRDAWIAYIGQSALPLILNGGDPVTALAAYDGAYLRQPFVRGNIHEGCFRSDGGLKTLYHDRWTHEGDTLLENVRLNRWGICFMMGTPTLGNRLYALASWWLTYDPRWSVAAPIDPVPSQTSLLPEFSIVPRFPFRTATVHVMSLRAPGGAFVREFRACFQNRLPIGGCATVVNPGADAVPMPALESSYRRSLALSGGDILNGGQASWVAGVPHVLGPGTAAVLAR